MDGPASETAAAAAAAAVEAAGGTAAATAPPMDRRTTTVTYWHWQEVNDCVYMDLSYSWLFEASCCCVCACKHHMLVSETRLCYLEYSESKQDIVVIYALLQFSDSCRLTVQAKWCTKETNMVAEMTESQSNSKGTKWISRICNAMLAFNRAKPATALSLLSDFKIATVCVVNIKCHRRLRR